MNLRLAQDPNSEHLGTTVWDASIVLAKFFEKVGRKVMVMYAVVMYAARVVCQSSITDLRCLHSCVEQCGPGSHLLL